MNSSEIILSEEEKNFCQKFIDSSSSCFAMDPSSSLQVISNSLMDAKDTVIAFDFDQTLKMAPKKGINEIASIRGGEETKKFLDQLIQQNYPILSNIHFLFISFIFQLLELCQQKNYFFYNS